MRVRFSEADAERAYDEWGANCGPGAIAAMMGLTLDELRPHMDDFEAKGYTNPTLMWRVLKNLGAKYHLVKPPAEFPRYGLARVQWDGPWTKPNVPARAAYRHTHWIGAQWSESAQEFGIFDINCINNGSGWVSLNDWRNIIAPYLMENHATKGNGKWFLTHVVEIERPGAA